MTRTARHARWLANQAYIRQTQAAQGHPETKQQGMKLTASWEEAEPVRDEVTVQLPTIHVQLGSLCLSTGLELDIRKAPRQVDLPGAQLIRRATSCPCAA